MENERICIKCNKELHDKEGYCSNCGMISGKLKKGTLFIKAKNVVPLGYFMILIGIGIIVAISVLLFNEVNLSTSLVGGLYGFGSVPIIMGFTMIKKWHEFINSRKNELKDDKDSLYCKYCYTALEKESNYCYFCGSKIK
jgi:RNA polymerase subunit RPABC4/transcription elongation factor Spt4